MFRGNHPTRVDEKGRLKLPAEFKRVIEDKYGPKFYITSVDGDVARVYPLEEWEQVETKLAALPSMNPSREAFVLATSYWGQEVEMDGQGRLLLPQLLREKADLKGDVDVIGAQRYLELRNGQATLKALEEKKLTREDRQALSDLGI